MNNTRNLELMALLEAYRMKVDKNRVEHSNPDVAIRICQAIISEFLGLPKCCAERNDAMKSAGLINYELYDYSDLDAQYKALHAVVFGGDVAA